MIENMYPIRKTETDIAKHSRKLPRNIRTCGQGGGPLPVYLEDYVETYIRRMAETGFPNCSAMILVGQVMETETGRCLFVRGGINANKICESDSPVFGEEIWSEVYEKIRRFFPDNEVVGWCIAGPGFRMLQEDVFLRAHIDNFGDSEKIFIAYESLEKELTIRICRYGSFCTLPGYYVYYEKNDEMQNYMLDAASYLHPQADKPLKEMKKVELPEELPEKKERKQRTSVRKDMFQLAAIACIIVLIVSVMVGTDALSVLKESTYANGEDTPGTTMAAEKTEKLNAEPTQDPDAFAFGNFDFLDDEPEEAVTVEKEENQEIAGSDKKPEEMQTMVSDEKKVETDAEEEQMLVSEKKQPETEKEKTEEEKQVAIQEPDIATKQDDPDRIEEETVTVLAPTEYSAYIVKPGDTLAQMCKEVYGTVELLDYICELNQLESVDRIYVGQELIFPKK